MIFSTVRIPIIWQEEGPFFDTLSGYSVRGRSYQSFSFPGRCVYCTQTASVWKDMSIKTKRVSMGLTTDKTETYSMKLKLPYCERHADKWDKYARYFDIPAIIIALLALVGSYIWLVADNISSEVDFGDAFFALCLFPFLAGLVLYVMSVPSRFIMEYIFSKRVKYVRDTPKPLSCGGSRDLGIAASFSEGGTNLELRFGSVEFGAIVRSRYRAPI